MLQSLDGGNTFSVATTHRGIDLGGNVTAVPEPSSALLAGVGTLFVGVATRRRSTKH